MEQSRESKAEKERCREIEIAKLFPVSALRITRLNRLDIVKRNQD
jgi:hypothetical protein